MSNLQVCVDANLVLRMVVPPQIPTIGSLWSQWEREQRQAVAPALLGYEVTNSLHRYRQSGVLSDGAADDALASILTLPIKLYADTDLHVSALQLARQYNLPAAYDAHYLALARLLNIDLWTGDRRLFRACAQSWVKLVE